MTEVSERPGGEPADRLERVDREDAGHERHVEPAGG